MRGAAQWEGREGGWGGRAAAAAGQAKCCVNIPNTHTKADGPVYCASHKNWIRNIRFSIVGKVGRILDVY